MFVAFANTDIAHLFFVEEVVVCFVDSVIQFALNRGRKGYANLAAAVKFHRTEVKSKAFGSSYHSDNRFAIVIWNLSIPDRAPGQSVDDVPDQHGLKRALVFRKKPLRASY